MVKSKKGPKVVSFSSGERETLFGVENLAVVRGNKDLIKRAARFANLGHGGIEPDSEDELTWQTVLSAVNELGPCKIPSEEAPVVTRLNIGNTYHCNMGCTYCYNELAVKDRKGSESPGGMSLDIAKKTIDALIAQSGNSSRLSLVFIGGEPLLEKSTLYETVDYAKKVGIQHGKRIDVAVYTNGTLMDEEVIKWSNDIGVSLVVSLDGPPLINDHNRVFLSGRPTAKIVLKNVRLLMKHSVHSVRRVRAVATEHTPLLALHRYFLDLGFNEIHIQAAYDQDGIDENESSSEILALLEWYKNLLLNGIVIGVNPFEGILERLAMRGSAITSWYPCTAGRSALGIGPKGDVYPCHHFLEEKNYYLGHVSNGLPDLEQRQPYFLRVDQREPCSSCWARHACGGECYHRAATSGRTYTGVIPDVCRSRKSLIGLTLDLFAEIATRKPDVFAKLITKNYSVVSLKESAYHSQDLIPWEQVKPQV
jgi:uncharacterized protein